MLIRSAATALAVLLALPALAQEATQGAPAATEAEPAEIQPVKDIPMGNDDAKVTIFEYASFTCGHCKNFHDQSWPKLKAEYIDTGKVNFIQRDIYFDQPGLWAGVLARCGGDDKYYAVSDMLFEDQKKWLAGSTGEEIAAGLRKIGLKAGMTEDQMNACWEDRTQIERLIATFQKNATADKIEATPTFIIGGDTVPNQPWEDMKAIIDAKLVEVEKLEAEAEAARIKE